MNAEAKKRVIETVTGFINGLAEGVEARIRIDYGHHRPFIPGNPNPPYEDNGTRTLTILVNGGAQRTSDFDQGAEFIMCPACCHPINITTNKTGKCSWCREKVFEPKGESGR